VLVIQLEFIFHISKAVVGVAQHLSNYIYAAFCATFLLAVYYAYKILQAKKEASHYQYIKYKKSDTYEGQKKIET
jgi:hypothetical protein